MSAAKEPWWLGPGAVAGTAVYAALAATWRLERFDDPDYAQAVATGERFVYAFWHARILSVTWWHRDEDIAVLVSQHRDGELITRLIEHMGYVTGRGSSTRGGEAGMRDMLKWARAGKQIALTPDGPRGPAGEVKDGLIVLAARLRRRIVPLAAAADRAWVTRSWDRHRIPQPFARVVLRHDAPIAVPHDVSAEALPELRAQVNAALHTCTRVTAERAREAA